MNRKPKADTYIPPMPKRKLKKLISEFENNGGRIYMSSDIQKYLDLKNAEAVTLNESTILLRKHPSRAAVYEELYHAQQFKDGKIDGTKISKILCEIEAKQYLLDNSNMLELTENEILSTKKSLDYYIKQMETYEKGRESRCSFIMF